MSLPIPGTRNGGGGTRREREREREVDEGVVGEKRKHSRKLEKDDGRGATAS